MKRKLFTLALAALTIGLLGSCSKINERIDGLDKRVNDLENTKIASVEQQIAAINRSIADLETIRTNIQNLKNEQEAQGQDITDLKAADITLEGKINGLKAYVNTELAKYATKDWANATFATLEQHQWTCDTIAKIDARIGALDAKLSQSISGLENSLKQWVNEQLDAYYTAAQMDAKLDVMRNDINNAKAQGKTATDKADSLATELIELKEVVDTEKAAIRTEYKEAIKVAIDSLDGEIRGALLDSIAAVNGRIEALDTRVTTLEGKVLALEGKVDKLLAMIQSMTIVPAYSDGSVEAVDGILTLKCIVSPAEAIIGMESLKDSLLIYADSVKVKTKGAASAYMKIEVSEASVLDAAQGAITLTADISEYLPKGKDKALTVAVNIKNGISDFTTKFVPVTNTTGGVRTIAVQFDNFTKATLDGFTPKFANGDAIRVSNTEKSEECTVSVDGSGKATFTTTLSGALTAIYPSAAAVLSSGGADAPIATSNNIKVPASQDGDVAKAIIAKAAIAVGSTSATFTSQTALFQITPPDGVKTFTITSLKPVVNGVARTGTATAINTDGATDAAKLVITVSNTDLTTFYVALKAGVNLSDLSFEYITDATNGLGAMKGIPAKDIAAAGMTDATAANTKYTIDNTNWHPYVEIEMAVQPGVGMPPVTKTYKWATMNIGATSATEAGKYFMWGETTGITPSGSSFSFPDSKYYSADNSSWNQTKGFAWENCPWTKGTYVLSSKENVFTKYVSASKTSYMAEGFAGDNKEILDLADDAANANWGGSWRMPNRWEFHGLTLKGWVSTNEGLKFGTSPNQIFLPLTGTGTGTDLNYAEDYCRYWSSSVGIDYPAVASHLYFAWDEIDPFMGDERYRGHAVRALSD